MRVRTFVLVFGCLVLGTASGAYAAGPPIDPADEAPSPAAAAHGAPGTAVRTESGLLLGTTGSTGTVYRGVPFAAPPVGPLRWRAPQPVAAWEGVREAETFSPRCPQIGAYPQDAPAEPMSEDCLYLNIWVPAASAGGPLPVMVWLHGGGLENGSASIPLYAGDRLAAHGVIVVTANYRLGVLGFLAHPGLSRESPEHVSGNYGLLDQIAVLRWVQRNIAAFGGDPQRVTVFGQSSGSIAVSVLTVSPLTKGLFQRAIGESGGLFEPLAFASGYSPHGAEAEGVDFAHQAGADDIQGLRAMPAEALLKLRFSPHFVVDGVALTESPYETYARGAQHDVELLLGFNAAEGQLFLGDRDVRPDNYRAALSEDFSPLLVRLLAPDPGGDDATARARAVAFEGDMRFVWDMWTWARLASETGFRRVYLYDFVRSPPGILTGLETSRGSMQAGPGATHGMEIPYVFGHLDPAAAAWTAQDRQLSAKMQAYWTQFAKSGNPNQAGLPNWSAVRSAPGSVMSLGEEIHMAPMPDLQTLRGIDRLYWTAYRVAAHPRAALAVALAIALALAQITLAAAAAGVRSWRRRLRAY